MGYFQVMRAMLADACLTVHADLCFAASLLYYQLNCCWPFPVGFSPPPGAVTASLQENLRPAWPAIAKKLIYFSDSVTSELCNLEEVVFIT